MRLRNAALWFAILPASAAPPSAITVGPQPDGSILMSTNQVITPAGTLVQLPPPARPKAVALNPNAATHTAAVLQMGAAGAVAIVDTGSGQVLQIYTPQRDKSGSYAGLAYSADGSKLYFSQDSSYLTVASVDAKTGLLTDGGRIALPPDRSLALNEPKTAYPGGIALSRDGAAFVLLNQNNTLAAVAPGGTGPALRAQIRVGNAPHSVVLAPDGLLYVSNEGGRGARAGDFTDLSSGTPIVTDPRTDSASTGTVSVVDPAGNNGQGTVVATIAVGRHPTGMAVAGSTLYVANAFDDSVSVIDTASNKVTATIRMPLPLAANGFGGMPCAIAAVGTTLYVALYTANAIAVVDTTDTANPVRGMIPTASTPDAIAYDAAHTQLVVANDKGIGTHHRRLSRYGVTAFNSHPDDGTLSLIPIPNTAELARDTAQVIRNNHWELAANTRIGPAAINPHAAPVPIPEHLGEPSTIKHIFLIIKENRTYDQLFGDLPGGMGDPSLAIFGLYVPNQRALVNQFAFLDNVYAPSRQSADGHPWIVSGIAAYPDDIQSPDWIRSYPGGNSDDAMVYTPRGFLWDAAIRRGLSVKMYGEWSTTQTIKGNWRWNDWHLLSQVLEKTATGHSPIKPEDNVELCTVPSAAAILDAHYPSFNLGIPDQYRVDYWLPIFAHQEATGTLPHLTILWLPNDHTSGYTAGFPVPQAAVADNDLALGRLVEAISHSRDWPTTAIFVEEDDAQDGVDHIDGHRQPVQVISPYAVHSHGTADHTIYTAANIDRTIEQILGLEPMTQFDLVASPMRTAFTRKPDLTPFAHRPPTIALDTFPTPADLHAHPREHATLTLPQAWARASAALFAGRTAKADAVDETVLNHLVWYASTRFARAYPGESAVLWPAAFGLGD